MMYLGFCCHFASLLKLDPYVDVDDIMGYDPK